MTFKSVPIQTGDEQHIYLFELQWARQVNLTTRKVIKGSAAKSDNYFYKLNNMSWLLRSQQESISLFKQIFLISGFTYTCYESKSMYFMSTGSDGIICAQSLNI